MLEKYEEAIRNILEKSYLAGYDKHPHFIKDYTDQIIEAVKPAIEEAKKERDLYFKEWLDDIFLCEFYNANDRDMLCRKLWESIKEGE